MASSSSNAARNLPAAAAERGAKGARREGGRGAFGAEPWRQLAFCSTAEARQLVPEQLAERLCALPLSIARPRRGGAPFLTVALAAAEPPAVLQPAAAIAELRFAAGMEIVVEAAPREHILQAISLAYRGQGRRLPEAAARAEASAASSIQAPPARRSNPAARAPAAAIDRSLPVPDLLQAILERAVFLSASDIHLDPAPSGIRLRFRVAGMLEDDESLSVISAAHHQLARRIKVLCDLELDCLGRAQEGVFTAAAAGANLRLRVSVLPVIHGEKIVMRLLECPADESGGGAAPFDLPSLGLLPEQCRVLCSSLALERGVILLSGPTGSGKSTLLYALLNMLNAKWRNLITLEDPVERLLAGVNQVEINPKQGLGFAEMLPRILRQDPDVMMVGEIRDPLTAQSAFEAGNAGTLVLSTVHAGSCLEVFVRLFNLKLDAALLASALRLVSSQRLLALNCEHCRRPERVEPFVRRLFKVEENAALYASVGCERCRGSGVGTRKGVYELLPLGEELRMRLAAAAAGAARAIDYSQLEDAAQETGYRPLAFAVRRALLSGECSSSAALKAVGIQPDFARS